MSESPDASREAKELIARIAAMGCEQDRLRARVDVLTAALTGLCDVYHVRPLNELLDGEETVSEDDGPKFAAWANARAVLSAGEEAL